MPRTTTVRPARATDCPECGGDGTEWDVVETDETDEETGAAVEQRVPYGRCEICDGRGWLPYESPAQRRDREARERAEDRARRIAQARAHVASGTCTGRRCWAVPSHRAIEALPELADLAAALD